MTDTRAAQHFKDTLGLEIQSLELLTQALTHSSYVNEYDGAAEVGDNERLEFLGDAVLDLIVAEMLYRRYPNVGEGELTQLRAALVKTESLAQLATDCRLGEYVRIGHGEEISGGRARQTTLCRAFEAVIGALYLDGGPDAVLDFVKPRLLSLLDHIVKHNLHIDARSELQERIQARLSTTPNYRVAGSEGPEHAKEFRVEVAIGDVIIGSGIGGSKRAAAQEAARAALLEIQAKGLPDSIL